MPFKILGDNTPYPNAIHGHGCGAQLKPIRFPLSPDQQQLVARQPLVLEGACHRFLSPTARESRTGPSASCPTSGLCTSVASVG